ncbi:hypothetical protein AABB24_028762 [Solanum stoloniferum]|uniref:Homeobox domain-containing protein n=1 Tax=Solanum stoloniferum TaxID=62892 RepID=A0ABD2S7U6_9SOLN
MMCNTRLSLSLGLSTTPPHQNNNKGKLSTNDDNQELTLCLSTSSEFTNNYDNNRINPQLLGGVNSSASSFSNTSSVKRERDASSFEEEVENLETKKVLLISPKGLVDHKDDDEEDVHDYGTRKKLRLTKEQSDVLEDSFKEHTTLNSKQKRDLARRLSLRPRQVEVWFQNRRARTKLKQTEVNCEILRKHYEELKDENRKLNKEIQKLKSLKKSQSFRVKLSAATLSMCQSCERTYNGGATDNSTKISYSIGDQKPHFYGIPSQIH